MNKETKFFHFSKKKGYDREIFKQFYKLLEENFLDKDELDSRKSMEYFLKNEEKNPLYSKGHYLIFMNENNVIAGAVLEYYPISNCGLLSYSKLSLLTFQSGC
jgi:hypothetical protein